MKLINFAALFMNHSPQWPSINRTLGWWILCCPPIGWLMALGYRKHVVIHLLNPTEGNEDQILPKTPHLFHLLLEGLCALGVMIVYFTPTLLLAFIWATDASPWVSITQFNQFLMYAFMTYTFPPITLGGVSTFYQNYVPWFELSYAQGCMIIFALMCSTFLIPLAFMQVGRRGLWRDAFRIDQAFQILVHHLQAYLCAWRDSLKLSCVALSLLHRAPWGIAWSYLGIVWLFNRIHAEQFPRNLILSSNSISSSFKLYHRWNVPIPMWWAIESQESTHDSN